MDFLHSEGEDGSLDTWWFITGGRGHETARKRKRKSESSMIPEDLRTPPNSCSATDVVCIF